MCALQWHSHRTPPPSPRQSIVGICEQVRRVAPRSFLTCHQHSKFHSCTRAPLIWCETLPLPPADALLLAFAPLSNRLCIPRGSRSRRPDEDTVKVIVADPRPTFGPTYVGNYCHVCIFRCSAMSNSAETSIASLDGYVARLINQLQLICLDSFITINFFYKRLIYFAITKKILQLYFHSEIINLFKVSQPWILN